jgi:hypothetical protein
VINAGKTGVFTGKLTDPSNPTKEAGEISISFEKLKYCSDTINLGVLAELKAVGGGCCGGGDHPYFTLSKEIVEGSN